jgi:hypothetical protein
MMSLFTKDQERYYNQLFKKLINNDANILIEKHLKTASEQEILYDDVERMYEQVYYLWSVQIQRESIREVYEEVLGEDVDDIDIMDLIYEDEIKWLDKVTSLLPNGWRVNYNDSGDLMLVRDWDNFNYIPIDLLNQLNVEVVAEISQRNNFCVRVYQWVETFDGGFGEDLMFINYCNSMEQAEQYINEGLPNNLKVIKVISV